MAKKGIRSQHTVCFPHHARSNFYKPLGCAFLLFIAGHGTYPSRFHREVHYMVDQYGTCDNDSCQQKLLIGFCCVHVLDYFVVLVVHLHDLAFSTGTYRDGGLASARGVNIQTVVYLT